jgi:hypothetical protein
MNTRHGFTDKSHMDSNGGGTIRVRMCSASRIGSEHLRVARNNQDAWAVRARGARLVAVVADGCSMGGASEVGAALGAAWIAQRVVRDDTAWCRAPDLRGALRALTADLDAVLSGCLATLADPELAADVAARYFLFGFLCLVVEDDRVLLFGLGDGLYSVDGEVVVIDPGPHNAPPYAAYRVLPAEALEGTPAELELTVHHRGELPSAPLFIATDGAIPLAAELGRWLEDEKVWDSAQALDRKLNLAERRLCDDTTVIAVRRP